MGIAERTTRLVRAHVTMTLGARTKSSHAILLPQSSGSGGGPYRGCAPPSKSPPSIGGMPYGGTAPEVDPPDDVVPDDPPDDDVPDVPPEDDVLDDPPEV